MTTPLEKKKEPRDSSMADRRTANRSGRKLPSEHLALLAVIGCDHFCGSWERKSQTPRMGKRRRD
jgi:hypothetical protein